MATFTNLNGSVDERLAVDYFIREWMRPSDILGMIEGLTEFTPAHNEETEEERRFLVRMLARRLLTDHGIDPGERLGLKIEDIV